MTTSHEGGCVCGAVRYRLASGPMIVHCCHCAACQRRTGTAFAVNALIEADRVDVLQGDPRPTDLPTESGRPLIDTGCPACGTSLWSDYGGRGKVLFVRTGTLDDPAAMPPDIHIFTRSKQPWVSLPDAARAFEVYYDTAAEWPPESLARRQAMAR